MKHISEILDEYYDKLLDKIISNPNVGDDLHDFVVELKTKAGGLTWRRSWKDRDDRLIENESKSKSVI